MELLKLPGLAQTVMLQQLTYFEIILLATCSKRTANAVSWNLRIPKLEIWVGTYQTNGFSDEIPFYLRVGGNRIKILSVRNFVPDWGNKQQMTIDGETFMFSSDFELFQFYHLRLYCPSPLGSLALLSQEAFFAKFTTIHRFLCEIFKAPLEIFLVLKTQERRYLHADTVSRCDFTKLCRFESKGMDDFFKVQPIKLSILDGILIAPEPKTLGNNHHFKCISNVLVKNAYENASLLFVIFNGEHLLLEDGIIQAGCLRRPLEKWIKKDGGNLKTLIVKWHQSYSIDKTALLEGITTEKCEKGKVFNYDSIIKEYHTFPIGAFDCTDGLDITRKTDGRRATVKVTNDYFMFLVW